MLDLGMLQELHTQEAKALIKLAKISKKSDDDDPNVSSQLRKFMNARKDTNIFINNMLNKNNGEK